MSMSELVVGKNLGPSSWFTVDQARINRFAEATDDYQWIHVDPVRSATGPFGTTIAHGWLTLALVAPFTFELLPLEDVAVINYGADRVRFPAPLPAGGRIRARFEIVGVDEVDLGVTQLRVAATIESDRGDKPVCVATLLFRVSPPPEGSKR
jgi:acyl dehydratase